MVKDEDNSTAQFSNSLGEDEFTVFEKARIIGSRALQIAQGAKPLIEVGEDMKESEKFNPIELAKREFEAGVIPISVKRNLPTHNQ